jgi:rhodanese-related sulfurtransferase
MTESIAAGRYAHLLAIAVNERPDAQTLVFGDVDAAERITVVCPTAAARVQIPGRFGAGVITPDAWTAVPEWERRLLVHNMVVHLAPGAIVVADTSADEIADHAAACGLTSAATNDALVFHRTERITIHDLVAEARAGLSRISPLDLAERLQVDPTCVVLDTRTPTDRERFGVIPNSVHMPRTTLEWMCDPASGYSHERVISFDQLLVAVCNEGYSSSLSAASLQRLGFVNATDLIGGVMGWKAADLPIDQPDHTRFN